MIECSGCGKPFQQYKRIGRRCRACEARYQRDYMRKYRERNADFEAKRYVERRANVEWVETERKRGRDYWQRLRHEAIMAYGGYRCACCGETEPKFLTLDHIFNDGNVHRKEIDKRGRGSAMFKWLKDHGYPAGFQILCMNCNHGKALNVGICPHQTKPAYANRVKTGEAQTG